MPGLRERKRQRTLTAIHEAGMRLFAERGYHAVTVTDIAEAADVSRATVFAYYPAKEDIVVGAAPDAIAQLRRALDEGARPVVDTVRDWLRTLAGWIEPDVVLQRRLADEVPAVAAARARVARDAETAIADALAREMGADGVPLVARLAAGSLAAALVAVEHEAAQRMAAGHGLAPAEVEALLDDAVAFVAAGLARLGPR